MISQHLLQEWENMINDLQVQIEDQTGLDQSQGSGDGVAPRSRVFHNTPPMSDDNLYSNLSKQETETITEPNCEISKSVKEYYEVIQSDHFSRIFESVREKQSIDWVGANTFCGLEFVFKQPALEEIEKFLLMNGQTDRTYINLEMFRDQRPASKSYKLKDFDHTVTSVWKVLCDIVKTTIIYGFLDYQDILRHRILKVFTQWVRMLNFLKYNFIKLTKYKLAAFAAFAKGSDIFPPSPFSQEFIEQNRVTRPYLIFDKIFDRWFHGLPDHDMQCKLYKMSLIDSICRGVKKGADRPTLEMAHLSNLDTFKLFTTEKVKPEIEDPDMVIHFSVPDMEAEIERTVDEIFKGVSEPVLEYGHFPSLSSCVENVFSNGGSLLPVKRRVGKYPRPFVGEKKFGILREPLPQSRNQTEEHDPLVRSPFPKEDILDSGSTFLSTPYLEVTSNYDNLGTDIDIELLVEKCILEGSQMKLVALLEALKIRGISTANALETFLLKPLQKLISKQLLKFACFAVTGTPLQPHHLERVMKSLLQKQLFVSGDYDNATNEMIKSYTEVCVRRMCMHLNLSVSYTQLAVNSLCNNTVSYTYMDEKHLKPQKLEGEQKEAQPMGKVLSFVVLCIINATVCRKAVEMDTHTRIKLRNFPGLINGDDCCFPMSNPDLWVKFSAMVGLKNSIGKTFFSNEFVEMNSRTFMVDLDNKDIVLLPSGDKIDLRFKEVPFVNFGLIKGMVRSSQVDGDCAIIERMTSLGECHHDLVRDLDFAYEFLDSEFKIYNSKSLNGRELCGIPYYIPKWLGGLGLNPGPRFFEKIKPIQRKQAKIIFQEYNQKKIAKISSEKTCLLDTRISEMEDELSRTLGIDFVEHSYTNIELQNGDILDLEKENQKVYTDAVELLWRNMHMLDLKTDLCDESGNPLCTGWDDPMFQKWQQTITPENWTNNTFHSFKSKAKIRKSLLNNSKIWLSAYARVQNSEVEPLPWYKIWHERKRGLLPIVRKDCVRDFMESQKLLMSEC
jgi:hypothetical protein